MANIYEGTKLTKEVKLTGDSATGEAINVEISYKRNGLEVKKETKSLLGGTKNLECEYEAPNLLEGEVSYELVRQVTKDTKPLDVETFTVWPKAGKLTVVNDKDSKPMPGFKFVVRKNGKQVGRIYETIAPVKDGPAEAPFPLDSNAEAGPYEIQAVSPYIIKSYTQPPTASPQPHSSAVSIKADKMPYTVVLESPGGAETEPPDATKVYSTDNPTTRGVGFLEIRIAASDRGKVVKGDSVNVEVECKRRSKRRDAKAPDVPGWTAKAEWAAGTAPYTLTRTWAKKLDITAGTVSFDIYLGVAGGDEFIIRAGMTAGQWDHQAKIETWRKIKVLVVRPVAALVGTFADDAKVLDEGVAKGAWETLAAAYRAAYIDCVPHSSSKRFNQLEIGSLSSKGKKMLKWTLPATVFGKASTEPDEFVFSQEAAATVLDSSWMVKEAGTVNALFVGMIVGQDDTQFRPDPKAPVLSDEIAATIPMPPGLFFLDANTPIHTPGPGLFLEVGIVQYDDGGTFKAVKGTPKFGVTNLSALPITRVGDKTTIDLTNAKFKLIARGAQSGDEITGLLSKDPTGKLSLGKEHLSIKKENDSPATVGTKLKINLTGKLATLNAAFGGYADGATTVTALNAKSGVTQRPSNAAGIGLILAHETAHFLGFSYLNPKDKDKGTDDGSAPNYNQTPILGVDYKKYFDEGGNGYFGKGGIGGHCNIGMTEEQKKAQMWIPAEANPLTGAKLTPWPECLMFGFAHPEPTKVEFCPDCLRVLREANILESSNGLLK